MSTQRTDVHAPSSTDFDPELYDCVGVFDNCTDPMQGGSTPEQRQARLALVNRLVEQGYRFGPGGSHQCGHCGAHLRYAALMTRSDVMEMIYVGETCLDGRFEMTKGEFATLRKNAQLGRERQRLLTGFREVCDENPGFAYATYLLNIDVALEVEASRELGYSDGFDAVCHAGLNWGINVGQDIVVKTRKYGSASPKQIALVERIVGEQDAKWNAFADKKRAQLATKATTPALSAGRQVIEGVVVAQKSESAYFGYTERTVYKMLVKLDDGQRVWGTEPASLRDAEKGDRVRLTATVEPKAEEPDFGFYSRPAKAEILTKVINTQEVA